MRREASLVAFSAGNTSSQLKKDTWGSWIQRIKNGDIKYARLISDTKVQIPLSNITVFGRAPFNDQQRQKAGDNYISLANCTEDPKNNGAPHGLSLCHFTIVMTEAVYMIALTTVNAKAVLRVTRDVLREDWEVEKIVYDVGTDGFILRNRDVIHAGHDPNCFSMTFFDHMSE